HRRFAKRRLWNRSGGRKTRRRVPHRRGGRLRCRFSLTPLTIGTSERQRLPSAPSLWVLARLRDLALHGDPPALCCSRQQRRLLSRSATLRGSSVFSCLRCLQGRSSSDTALPTSACAAASRFRLPTSCC